MSSPRYLVDTSVVLRSTLTRVVDRIEELATAGKLWTCRMVDLEYVYSTRAREVQEAIAEREVLPDAPITPEVMGRALHVAGLLAAAGRHRGAKPADLIIAAAAEARGLTVLHYDDDFDRIAAVTGQPTEWVFPKGSLEH